MDLGTRNAVASALKRFKQTGVLKQILRGLYIVPQHDSQLGELAPSMKAILEAIQDRDSIRIQPAGGYAANLLGLSDQVPLNPVFLTDGPNHRIRLGHQSITLKHTTPRAMSVAGRISGLVIQALRHIGKQHVDDSHLKKLSSRLSDKDKQQLLRDIRYAPAWIVPHINQIAKSEGK